MNLNIDKHTGNILFAGEYVISSKLTIPDIVSAPINARRYNTSSLPYQWFSANSGDQSIELCFYNNLIVWADFHMTVKFNNDFSTEHFDEVFSEQQACERKSLNDITLNRILGEDGVVHARRVPDDSARGGDLVFSYAWGTVSSIHDPRTNNVFVRVEYAGRRGRAEMPFDRVKKFVGDYSLQRLRSRISEKEAS